MLKEGQQLGPYRIVRLLGEGGMGAVYEARQEPLDRRVAIKTLHAEHAKNKESIARFFNEAKVLSRLEHPSIVQVSDFGYADDGAAYLAMEYLRGQSLAARLRELSIRGERLALPTALQICVQVADVLGVAHGEGIVHRDLKPENLMLVADPVAPGGERVKVLDFGIAKLTTDQSGVKTGTDQMMGTPAYMSPEQCAGAGGVDAQTDVYALGCVLYELLAGKRPFVADGLGLLLAMHMFEEPTPLLSIVPALPAPVAELVHRMLRKDKKQRPTIQEVARDLSNLLSSVPSRLEVLRELHAVKIEQIASSSLPTAAQVSTIGRSNGQQETGSTGAKTGIRVSIVGLAMVAGVVGLWMTLEPLQKARPASATQIVVPNLGPQDLGIDSSTSSGTESSAHESENATDLGSTKQTTPSAARNPPERPSVRPVKKAHAKKRFGYEE